HAVLAAERAAEGGELLAQLGVRVAARVAGEPRVSRLERRLRLVVAARGRDDAARAVEQRLRVARDLRPRRREPHLREQPPRAPLADVALGAGIRLGARDADRVEAE